MAELVDALDLGSSIVRCEGSSPFVRSHFITTQKIESPLAGFPDQPNLVSLLQNWLSGR